MQKVDTVDPHQSQAICSRSLERSEQVLQYQHFYCRHRRLCETYYRVVRSLSRNFQDFLLSQAHSYVAEIKTEN